jgi:hypothetical protein
VKECVAVHVLMISLGNFQRIILILICVCVTLVILFMMVPPIATGQWTVRKSAESID